jgi:hypothetical protein
MHNRRYDIVLVPSFFDGFTVCFLKELFSVLVPAALVKLYGVDLHKVPLHGTFES